MGRLILVRHATTPSTRRAAFPITTGREPAGDACESLDRAGQRQARALARFVPSAQRVWTSHARRAIETGAGIGLGEAERRADLAELDFGRWRGQTLDEVHARDPEGLERWLHDPGEAPHGGETLTGLRRRARGVLDLAESLDGTTVAISHGGWIKAALLEALRLSHTAVWQLDVAPASLTELRSGPRGWGLVCSSWTPRGRVPTAEPERPCAAE